MKIIKDNYTMKENKAADVKPYPRAIICESCNSELQYEKQDIEIGEFGCAFVKCPLCGYDNYTSDEDEDMVLTIDNIEFPVHFSHTSKENAIDCCNNEMVREYIRKAIEYFRTHKEEYDYGGYITGNLYIQVHRYSGDEDYEVIVSNDFYTTNIPFEPIDY